VQRAQVQTYKISKLANLVSKAASLARLSGRLTNQSNSGLLGVIQRLVYMRVLQLLLQMTKRMLHGLLHALFGMVLPMRCGNLLSHGGYSDGTFY
jgi:hypothetical protein